MALEGEGITWTGQPSRQGIARFVVRIEFWRSTGSSSGLPLAGHIHAAAFSYRPVQRGQIDLKASIKMLFEEQALEGILHLLSDERAISGGGQSELVRGACWIAPISNIKVEGTQA